MKITFNAEVELKPCPFCGGMDFTLTSREDHDELREKNYGPCVCLTCKGCYAQMYVPHAYTGCDDPMRGVTYDQKLQILAARWNGRANNG